jgi:hypothetical protein
MSEEATVSPIAQLIAYCHAPDEAYMCLNSLKFYVWMNVAGVDRTLVQSYYPIGGLATPIRFIDRVILPRRTATTDFQE